jgi:hypothetical protein
MMRSITCLSVLTLALGLGACGDDGDEPTTAAPTTNATPSTMSDGTTTDVTTTADGSATDGTTTAPTTDATTTTDGTTTAPTTDATTTTDGTATDGTTGPDATVGETTMGGSTTTGGGADLYGPCEMADPPCPGDQQCLMVGGIDGNFCAPACDGMSCPDKPDGVTAMAQCVLSAEGEMMPTSCALICNPMGGDDQCGVGLSCKAVPMQAGVGLCTAP